MTLPNLHSCQQDPSDGWDSVYAAKGTAGVSWYEACPAISLSWIEALAPARDSSLIDIGSGASTLVDGLLSRGYRQITLLDRSAIALALTRSRLQSDARLCQASGALVWRQADLLAAELPRQGFDLWHDRAVFHFLTSEMQRQRYRQQLQRALRPGGHLVIATFASDGPSRCSGRPVKRYALDELLAALGPGLHPLDHAHCSHQTPSGDRQSFLYVRCRRLS